MQEVILCTFVCSAHRISLTLFFVYKSFDLIMNFLVISKTVGTNITSYFQGTAAIRPQPYMSAVIHLMA